MYLSINGKLVQDQEASIPLSSEAFLYGYGIFETIKFENNKIYFLTEHLERLKAGCTKVNLELALESFVIEAYCYQLINTNHLQKGVLKILIAKNGSTNDLIISVRENKYTDEHYMQGFKLGFTSIKRNPYSLTAYIKSNNYMENLIARQQGLDQGYQEVVFENIDGKVCEGALSNIFFIKDDIIYTPSVDCGLLAGIMRSKVIELIKTLNIECEIGAYTKEDLLNADEIFITNSLMEIMPVSYLHNQIFDVSKNFITQRLIKAFKEYLTTQS